MFLRAMARVGWSTSRSSGPSPSASRVSVRRPGGASRSKAFRTVTASIPRSASSRREKSLIVTWTARGMRGGSSVIIGRLRSLPGEVVVVEQHPGLARQLGQHRGEDPGRLQVEGQRQHVLHHHDVRAGQRRSAARRRAGPPGAAGRCPAGPGAASAATARPGTTTSPGRGPSASSPATRRSEYPRCSRARPQVAAWTDTPSGPPSRNDTIDATAMGGDFS